MVVGEGRQELAKTRVKKHDTYQPYQILPAFLHAMRPEAVVLAVVSQ